MAKTDIKNWQRENPEAHKQVCAGFSKVNAHYSDFIVELTNSDIWDFPARASLDNLVL